LKQPDMTEAEIRRDYVPLVREHVRRAHGVICVSEYTASEARLLLDVQPERIAVIPNGVDPAYRVPPPPEAIEAVLLRRRIPRGASMGGLIEIHGNGGRGKDWTKGCVALRNSDMDDLFRRTSVGTPVTIVGGDGQGVFARLVREHAAAPAGGTQ